MKNMDRRVKMPDNKIYLKSIDNHEKVKTPHAPLIFHSFLTILVLVDITHIQPTKVSHEWTFIKAD